MENESLGFGNVQQSCHIIYFCNFRNFRCQQSLELFFPATHRPINFVTLETLQTYLAELRAQEHRLGSPAEG